MSVDSPGEYKDDPIVVAVERAERRVVACSFLLAKILSVVALLLCLALIEAATIKHLWESEISVPSKAIGDR
jgi:hypothetical protein